MPISLSAWSLRAQQAYLLAEEDARQRQHKQITVHHMFIGLAEETRGLAGRLLRAEGITGERIRKVFPHWHIFDAGRSLLQPPLAPVTERLLENNLPLSLNDLGGKIVSTRHVLLALLELPGLILLQMLKVDQGHLRRTVYEASGLDASPLLGYEIDEPCYTF